VLHSGLRLFIYSGSCYLLYAMLIIKKIRHTCCWSVYYLCLLCNWCVYILVLVGILNRKCQFSPWQIGTSWTILCQLCWHAVKQQPFNQWGQVALLRRPLKQIWLIDCSYHCIIVFIKSSWLQLCNVAHQFSHHLLYLVHCLSEVCVRACVRACVCY